MPRRIARCTRPGNRLSQGQVLPRWGNPPRRGQIRVTSNSCEKLLAEGFFLLKDLTVTRMPLATALKDCNKSINCQKVVCPSFFWLHAWRIFTNLEKVHNGTRAGILHVNAGYFFTPSERVTLPRIPHFRVNRP